jgi:hypothetical protein
MDADLVAPVHRRGGVTGFTIFSRQFLDIVGIHGPIPVRRRGGARLGFLLVPTIGSFYPLPPTR